MKALQKFSSLYASVHNRFSQERPSSAVKFTGRDAQPRWPSGAPPWPKARLGLGGVRLGGDKLALA